MWNRRFLESIFETLQPINVERNDTRFYKASCDGKQFFIKEHLDKCNARKIERSERINTYFCKKGIDTVTAVAFEGEYTHIHRNSCFVAYPWVEMCTISNADCEISRAIGRLISKIHMVSKEQQRYEEPNPIVFSWQCSTMNDFAPFHSHFDEIKYYAEYGKQCLTVLSKEPHLLSHGDIHPGNLYLSHNALTLFDWDLADYYHPYSEAFDAALNVCGFCDGNTDLQRFEAVIKGYKDGPIVYDIDEERANNVIGASYYDILRAMNLALTFAQTTKDTTMFERAMKYFCQFKELTEYAGMFAKVLVQ